MSLEATVVCVDNSEHTRSGDYAPTRFQAQADAVNLLAGAKTQANAESCVGVLTMAGKTPRILVTPTPDLGRVLNSMANIEIEGEANFASSVQIAQLALKHRANKNQRQRIVMFVGSPLQETQDKLVRIAKKLKKNNVAVDIVSFGAEADNSEKLDAFIEAVNSSDNSHLVMVPAGTILSDMLFGSPIYQQDGGAGYAGGGGGAGAEGGEVPGGFEFGVDPSLDPELALALRVSLEEEQARARAAGGEEAPAEGTAAAAGQPAATDAAAGAGGSGADAAEPMDEDALLQQALAMSMDVDAPAAPDAAASQPLASAAAPVQPAQPPAPEARPAADTAMDDIEDPDLAAALQMSMADFQEPQAAAPSAPATSQAAPATSAAPAAGVSNLLGDADYLRSVLGSLPGVDTNDPALQSTLRDLQGGSGGASESKDEGADKEEGEDKDKST